jgi:hypothetical protein
VLRPRPAAAAIAAALLLASCGGGEDEPPAPDVPADQMLDRAFQQLPASGRALIDLEALLPQDPTEPVAAQLEGPFSNDGAAIPSFDLAGEAEAMGFAVEVSLVSTGDDAFVVFFGENYRVGSDRVAALGQRARGFDPRAWFGPAEHAGTEEVDGVEAYRIEGPLNTEEVRADLGSIGLAGVNSRGLEGGTVNAWIGVEDGVIRRLQLSSDAVNLDLVLMDLGEPQEIERPPGGGFQPIEDLLRRIPGL